LRVGVSGDGISSIYPQIPLLSNQRTFSPVLCESGI